MEEKRKRGRPRKVVAVDDEYEYIEVEEVKEEPKYDADSQMLGVLAIIASGLSFFVGMFILQIIGIALAAFAPKKNELHYIAIGLGVLSLIADILVVNSYY